MILKFERSIKYMRRFELACYVFVLTTQYVHYITIIVF